MPAWTEPSDLTAAVRKQWDKGKILSEMTSELGRTNVPGRLDKLHHTKSASAAIGSQGALFPLRLKLVGPSTTQVHEHFADVAKWISRLKEASKEKLGYGYELLEVERKFQGLGQNTLPTHAVIPTIDDALRMLRKTGEAKRSLRFSSAILTRFPDADENLRPWLAKRALSLLAYSEDIERIIAVMTWFTEHPHSGLYLRQLDIPGVDTKFIERHSDVLGNLLQLILPPEHVVQSAKRFEERFGLLSKPTMIRYRLLDPKLPGTTLTDIQTPISQFATNKPCVPIVRVFITENKINGLTFPTTEQSMVIFGLGYGLDILQTVPWLADLPIHYWGDLDTHGFAMLNQLRGYLPQVQSFLMDEKTLLDSKSLWDYEPKQQAVDLPRLTSAELHVYNLLRDNTLGKGVRLEQELIPFFAVTQTIAKIVALG